MHFSQVVVTAFFAIPVFTLLTIAVIAIFTSVRGIMDALTEDAAEGHAFIIAIGLICLVLSAALIAGGAALVRWLA